MKAHRPLAVWIVFFIVLNLYTSLTPRLFDQQNILNWMLYWGGFFLMVSTISLYALKLNGLKSFGLSMHKGWGLNIAVGFLSGSFIYSLKYFVFYRLEKFEIVGLMEPDFVFPMLSQALLAMLFSSLMNDILIKGYWLPYFSQRKVMKWFLPTVTLIYALDDIWNEGFDPVNILFSAVLGFSLAFTVLKTGSVWLSFGIHWGGNMVYRALYGFTGQGIWETRTLSESIVFDWISIGVTALLFPIVYILTKTRIPGAGKTADAEPRYITN